MRTETERDAEAAVWTPMRAAHAGTAPNLNLSPRTSTRCPVVAAMAAEAELVCMGTDRVQKTDVASYLRPYHCCEADGWRLRRAEPLSTPDPAVLTVLTQAVSDQGGAVPGQRTVVDALHGAATAADAADSTAGMEPAFGRAAWLPDRARGTRDARAVAWATYLGALSAAVNCSG